MYPIQQICSVCTVLVLTAVTAQNIQGNDVLNECSRGLRRPHPTQENGFQIFVRNGWRSQWLDRQCPQYQIYDQKLCGCMEVHQPRPEPRQTNFQVENNRQVDDCPFHRRGANGPSTYERLGEDGWIQEDCNWPFYTGLIWDQDNCRCEWGPNPSFPEIIDHSNVFVPATCLLMLNMTFDDAIKDEGRDLWLKKNVKDSSHIISDPGAIGNAAQFYGESNIAVPYFKGNSFGTRFKVAFRFKPCDDQQEFKIDKVCDGGKNPPFEFTYTAWDNIFTVAMDTLNSNGPIIESCPVSRTNNGWYNVVIVYQDNFLDVKINDVPCIGSDKFIGELKTTDCPMNFPGSSYCGMLDEFYITRGCQY
ncbi:hypothetical protein LOTGIDRAFT_168772 [Lottia gigantea]|uniref:Uncharacterized protein n=1 Tax=Lottia gigantea TaxID=225164 RepID=V3Z1C2_LOTGI|nr:hypothetical protein LOTGIDRAFT_168772 [Lottia gigantea]ESO84328.1 hypothetical protein LOTGIDRAFT_168772 [Lottia gigantea]